MLWPDATMPLNLQEDSDTDSDEFEEEAEVDVDAIDGAASSATSDYANDDDAVASLPADEAEVTSSNDEQGGGGGPEPFHSPSANEASSRDGARKLVEDPASVGGASVSTADASSSNAPHTPFKAPDVNELIEVEVVDDECLTEGVAEWRRAHVELLLPGQRFMVCVHKPDGTPDTDFREWFGQREENIDWRRIEGAPRYVGSETWRQPQLAAPRSSWNPWSEDEKLMLTKIMTAGEDLPWSDVAAALKTGRSEGAVSQYWRSNARELLGLHTPRAAPRWLPWSEEEKVALTKMMTAEEEMTWSDVAAALKTGRSEAAVCTYWRNNEHRLLGTEAVPAQSRRSSRLVNDGRVARSSGSGVKEYVADFAPTFRRAPTKWWTDDEKALLCELASAPEPMTWDAIARGLHSLSGIHRSESSVYTYWITNGDRLRRNHPETVCSSGGGRGSAVAIGRGGAVGSVGGGQGGATSGASGEIRRWSDDEKALLCQLSHSTTPIPWEAVAAAMGRSNARSVQTYYYKNRERLQESHSAGYESSKVRPWTEVEALLLGELRSGEEKVPLHVVAGLLGRSASAVQQFWQRKMDELLVKRPRAADGDDGGTDGKKRPKVAAPPVTPLWTAPPPPTAPPPTASHVLPPRPQTSAASGAPLPACTAPPTSAEALDAQGMMAAVAEMLRRFRLEQYIAAFDDAGYDDLVYLRSMDDAMVDRLVADVGMKVGHAARFRFYLQEERARLRAGGAASAGDAQHDAQTG